MIGKKNDWEHNVKNSGKDLIGKISTFSQTLGVDNKGEDQCNSSKIICNYGDENVRKNDNK